MLQKSQIYRLDGGGRKNQDDSVVDHRNRRPHNRNSPSTETEEHNLQFAIARAVLLVCPSCSPKSCTVHVEKVIVFSFCFWSFAFTMFSSILGDCTSEKIPGKCKPPPPLLYYTMPACSACCLRCWQLYRADVEAKKAELKWRRRQLMWRRRIIMKASTKAKLHA